MKNRFDNYNRYDDDNYDKYDLEWGGASSGETCVYLEDKIKQLQELLSNIREQYYKVVIEAETAKKDLDTEKALLKMKNAEMDGLDGKIKELKEKIEGMQDFTRFDVMILD